MQKHLTEEQLIVLDQEIDAIVPSFELLKASRKYAIRAILTEFDGFAQSFGNNPDLSQRMLAYRNAYQALDHIVRWIDVHCPIETDFIPVNGTSCAMNLLMTAMQYDRIYVQMSLAFRKRNKIEEVASGQYLVTSAIDENQELETARSLMAAADFPDSHEDASDMTFEAANELRKEISIDGIQGRQLRYSFPKSTYNKAFSVTQERRLYDFSMNPEWDLGGYKFIHVQEVWNTLKTLQSLHQLAVQKLFREEDRRRIYLKVRTRDEWVAEISKYAGLESGIVEKVFDDLVYNRSLHKPRQKKGHVMYQPFIELGSDQIVQCNALVMMSVVEKCSWILTELLRPKVHGELKNLKESYWIDEEFKRFESAKLRVFPRIKYSADGDSGDIDVILFDVEANFALVAQLKWTTSLDNVAGVESDDNQYAEGVDQARRSLNWAETHRAELAERLGLEKSVLMSTTLRPIVISKETLPSGKFIATEVPVINEALFRWIMTDPHDATLVELWKIADGCQYLPKEGVHFKNFDPLPIEWGRFKFELKDVAYQPTDCRWDPAVDIQLS